MPEGPARQPNTAAAFAGFFFLLCGISVLRPSLDKAGIARGVAALPAMFGATFFAVLAGAVLVAWLSTRIPRSWYLPLAYRVFGSGLAGASIALHAGALWAHTAL